MQREGGRGGGEEKGRRRGEENAFQLGITCRLTHTHAQQLCQSNAPWHVRGQITRESVIKMPLILASSSEQKENASAQKVLTSNY